MRKIAKSGIRSVKKAQVGDTTSRKKMSPDALDIQKKLARDQYLRETTRPDTLSSGERSYRTNMMLEEIKKKQAAMKQRKGGKTAAKVAKKGTKVAVTKKAKYGTAKKASSKRSK
jgi:hypothetical protein